MPYFTKISRSSAGCINKQLYGEVVLDSFKLISEKLVFVSK